jgi:hypothetical protein
MNWAEAVEAVLMTGLLGGAMYVLGKVIASNAPVDVDGHDPRSDHYAPFVVMEDSDGGDKEVAPDEDNAEEVDEAEQEPPVVAPSVVDLQLLAAATALGISATATEDEIRAALRRRLASSRLHPDQGGDGEEARRLIAAKNLMMERARARAFHS